jgi:hypothetical protein
MHTINARNVNDALPAGLGLLYEKGKPHTARGAETLEYPGPVATVYHCPTERVLFDPDRNANPFFHFFESLWILAGRNDVEFLASFNSKMRDYSDNGTSFHGAYGWRLHSPFDQVREVIELLKRDPDTRRAVLSIWNPALDLNYDSKDIPCNDLVMFKVRSGRLNMTVCNRSNDIVWGAYGANAVQFSMLQEYIAACTGYAVGNYVQMSDSYHVYTDLQYWIDWCDSVKPVQVECRYSKGLVQPYPLFAEPKLFASDLNQFFARIDMLPSDAPVHSMLPASVAFREVVLPFYNGWRTWRRHRDVVETNAILQHVQASDWRQAAIEWVLRADRSIKRATYGRA